tara:strand:- start:150 stop:1082 length:933 start_codon:yes stop_codon:yes gene_type:complete
MAVSDDFGGSSDFGGGFDSSSQSYGGDSDPGGMTGAGAPVSQGGVTPDAFGGSSTASTGGGQSKLEGGTKADNLQGGLKNTTKLSAFEIELDRNAIRNDTRNLTATPGSYIQAAQNQTFTDPKTGIESEEIGIHPSQSIGTFTSKDNKGNDVTIGSYMPNGPSDPRNTIDKALDFSENNKIASAGISLATMPLDALTFGVGGTIASTGIKAGLESLGPKGLQSLGLDPGRVAGGKEGGVKSRGGNPFSGKDTNGRIFGDDNSSTPIKKRGSAKGITKSIPNSTSLAIAENDQGPTRNQLRKARRQIIRYR